MRRQTVGSAHRSCVVVLLFALATTGLSRAASAGQDPVLEWNTHLNTAVLAGGTGPLPATRVTALVQAAVFDAVNGIAGQYPSIHVARTGHAGASPEAAAIQAAYAMLVRVYPLQAATLLTKRDASLAALALSRGDAGRGAVERGVAWGQHVADEIWAWRSTDGFAPNPPPPFRGAAVDGVWRPTPPANLDGAGPNFATMTPWVLERPSLFRPGPPPALTSAQYTADYNEVKDWGRAVGSLRSSDQDVLSVFWTSNTPLSWNRVAAQLLASDGSSLLDRAHVLALVNVAMADAAIGCWDAKHRYVYWRPISAITDADDGNPDTVSDPTFTSWLTTPNHPEYTSGHSCVSGAASGVLAARYGDETHFTFTSEVLMGGNPIPDRSFTSFTEVLDEIFRARIYGGIHFRTACEQGAGIGRQVSEYVLEHLGGARR
jgi:hypothetical protein